MKYAAALSMIYEFGDCAPDEEFNCETLLSRNNVNEDDAWWSWLALVALFAFFRIGALLLLQKRASEFS